MWKLSRERHYIVCAKLKRAKVTLKYAYADFAHLNILTKIFQQIKIFFGTKGNFPSDIFNLNNYV